MYKGEMRNLENGKRMSINFAVSDMITKRNIDRIRSGDLPSTSDEINKKKQMELGTKLYKENSQLSDEEVRKYGFYVLRQYTVEKRRDYVAKRVFECGKYYYRMGESLSEVPSIYQNNENFLNGYAFEAGADYYGQGNDIQESEFMDNEYFNQGYNSAKSEENKKKSR